MKPIKFIEAKGKNKRIGIYLLKDGKDMAFHVTTKTLIDFKTRRISETANLYSIETFVVLRDLMIYMLRDSEVENKIILKELNKINKFKAISNLNK